MKKNIIPLICLILLAALPFSCVKDLGSHTYKDQQKVIITFDNAQNDQMQGFIGEELTINPTLKWLVKDTANLQYQWLINGVPAFEGKTFQMMPQNVGAMFIQLIIKDTVSGYNNLSPIERLVISSPFARGFAILYNVGGKSVLGQIRVNGQEYIDYSDLYGMLNNGEELGSDPTHLQEFEIGDTGRGLIILQNGGQGSVELDGFTYKKELTEKEAFRNNVPAGFNPQSLAMLRTADYMLNADGQLYYRFFLNPIPFTTPWNPQPATYPGGMHIKAIWQTWSTVNGSAMMYDSLNNRLLEIQTDDGGGSIVDMPDADPFYPYPPGFPPLNNMGNQQYIWGGTSMDIPGYRECMLLLRDPADNNIYFYTFNYYSGFYTSLEPGSKTLFAGTNLITPKTIFYAIKGQGYLLFTAGANNDQLYYYDSQTGAPPQLYVQTESPITTIATNSNPEGNDAVTVAVGMQNGTTVLYEFSNATVLSGQSKELHRFTHAGKVVDIATRGDW